MYQRSPLDLNRTLDPTYRVNIVNRVRKLGSPKIHLNKVGDVDQTENVQDHDPHSVNNSQTLSADISMNDELNELDRYDEGNKGGECMV